LDRNASFFDLGGDSLGSVMLHEAVEQQFGKQISPEDFFAEPTFSTLLKLVASGGELTASGTAEATVPWPLPADLRGKLLRAFAVWDGNRPTRDKLVAGLNVDGWKIPLFWVFQEAVEFRKVASALGQDQPLYAFRSGLGLLSYSENEIQAFALRYVSEIEEVCPEGPVFVGGFCQGAVIALAMAQHLLRRKRHVPLLILMEWGFPLQPYSEPVLLIHSRDSRDGNPYLRYRMPESGLSRAFPQYTIAEMPGDHDHTFEDANVAALGKILSAHMRQAEQAPPRLMPKAAFGADLSADGIPQMMIEGQCANISVNVRNASKVIWPATHHSGLMIGNRWVDDAGHIIIMIDGRAPISELAPGEEARLSLPIVAPHRPGLVQLVLDVVEEGNTWFHPAGDAPLRVPVKIFSSVDESSLLAELLLTRKALSAYQASHSWRLTSPLRRIKSATFQFLDYRRK
jgi:Phosphopantetheine attachment site/Thioesterase domain